MDLETYKRLSAANKVQQPEVQQAVVDPSSLTATVGRASGGLRDSFGRGVSLIGRLSDSPELQEFGAGVSQRGVEHASKFGDAPVPFYSDVKDAKGAMQWLQEPVIGGLVSTLPVVGAAAVPAIFKMTKTALAVAGITGFGLNLGDVDQALQAADPGKNHDLAAVGLAIPMAGLDMFGASVILGPMIKQQGKSAVTAALLKSGKYTPAQISKMVEQADITGYAGHALKSGLTESGVETTQEALKLAGVAQITDTSLPEKTPEFLVNAGVGGFGGGAIVGGSVNALEGTGQAAARKLTPVRDKVTEGIQNSRLMAFLGVAGSQRLKPLAKHSPSIQKILDYMVPNQTGLVASGATIPERQQLSIGKHMSLIEQSGLMTMPDEQIKAEFDAYAQGKRDTAAQQAIASVYEDINTRGQALGLTDSKIPNYISLHTDIEKIQQNRQQFLEDLKPYYEDPEAMLLGYETALQNKHEMDNMLPRVDRRYLEETPEGTFIVKEEFRKNAQEDQLKYAIGQGQMLPKAQQLEGTRYFNKVPQAIMNKYAKEQKGKEYVQALRDYVEATEHRLAGVEAFGANNEVLNYLIAQASQELAAKGMKLPKATVDRIYDIVDAHNGVLNLPSDPVIRDTVGKAVSLTNMMKLPLSGVSSVIEAFLPAIQGEVGTMLRGIFPMVHQNVVNILDGATKNVPRSEMAKLASELNITYKAAINTMAERTNDAMLSRGMATTSKWFYQLNGQTPLLHAYKVGAVVQGESIVKRNLLEIASGINPQSQKFVYYTNQLRTLGIDIQTREQAMELYAPQGEAQRAFAKEKINLAVRRFVDMSHFHPDAFNTSLWMHDGNFKAFSGLKKYASALTNNLMPQMARKFNSNYTGGGAHQMGAIISLAGTMAAMMVFGSGMDWAKRQMRGVGDKPDNRTLNQKLVDVASLAWLPLPASFAADVIDSVRYGRAPTSVLGGPLLGVVDDNLVNIAKLAENPQDGAIWQKFVFINTPLNSFKAHFE